MWKETEILKRIVSDKAFRSHDTGSIHLEETKSNAKLRSIYIDKLSKEGITLKLDYDKDSFFKKNYGNRRCDFIVLSEAGNERVALFIDMKSTSFSDVDVVEKFPHDLGKGYPDYVTQLRSSSCFFEFLNIVMKKFCSHGALTRYIKRRHRFFVVLHAKDINAISRPITLTRPKYNDTPERALILSVKNDQHLIFQNLVFS